MFDNHTYINLSSQPYNVMVLLSGPFHLCRKMAEQQAHMPPVARVVYAHPEFWIASKVTPNVIGAEAPTPNPSKELC